MRHSLTSNLSSELRPDISQRDFFFSIKRTADYVNVSPCSQENTQKHKEMKKMNIKMKQEKKKRGDGEGGGGEEEELQVKNKEPPRLRRFKLGWAEPYQRSLQPARSSKLFPGCPF